MNNLSRKISQFFFNNRNRGIRNLMLFVAIGNVLVYLFANMDPSGALLSALSFSRQRILEGQVWRLFTYIFIPSGGYPLTILIMMFFYFQIGRILEARWGVARFNAYYLCGILITDLAALLLNVRASASYLNLSLILAFASTCPEDQVLLFFIIPLKMKWLAWFYFATVAYTVLFSPFPVKLFPLFALLNYFLFCHRDIRYLLPTSWQHRRPKPIFPGGSRQKPSPHWADGYRSQEGKKPYRHKCTVCGRTDTDYPDLEFRYCSRCKGYHCYCIDHINNHAHIQ